jgi:5-methylcytosine-specific restriction endonuclease McrA
MQRDGLSPTLSLDAVTGAVFFHMWKTQQHPCSVLKNGDTVFAVDGQDRTILWEFRVANVYLKRYTSLVHAFRQLDQHFGLSPADCNSYVWDRATEGWILAFEVEVIQRLHISIPKELNFVSLGGRNGWVAVDNIPEPLLKQLGLPEIGGPAITTPAKRSNSSDTDSEPKQRHRPHRRTVPHGVKQIVLERDGRCCRICRRADAEMEIHFDHKFPWSKGGPNTPDNIQILCSTCNLRKGAKVPSGVPRPSDAWDADGWADELARIRRLRSEAKDGSAEAALELSAEVGDTEAVDLLQGVLNSAKTNQHAMAAALLAEQKLFLDDGGEVSRLAQLALQGPDPEAKSRAALTLVLLEGEEMLLDRNGTKEARELLELALLSADQLCRSEAAVILADIEGEGSHRFLDLLAEAMKSPDPETRAVAALYLAQADPKGDREQLLYEALGANEESIRDEAMLELAVHLYNQGRETPVTHLLSLAKASSNDETVQEAKQFETDLGFH